MSDTVKAALIIGICLMLGLWGAGWLSKSDVGRWQRYGMEMQNARLQWKIDTATGKIGRD